MHCSAVGTTLDGQHAAALYSIDGGQTWLPAKILLAKGYFTAVKCNGPYCIALLEGAWILAEGTPIYYAYSVDGGKSYALNFPTPPASPETTMGLNIPTYKDNYDIYFYDINDGAGEIPSYRGDCKEMTGLDPNDPDKEVVICGHDTDGNGTIVLEKGTNDF